MRLPRPEDMTPVETKPEEPKPQGSVSVEVLPEV
jgi:hypothetical protein